MADLRIVIVLIVWAVIGSLFTSMILLVEADNNYDMPTGITYGETKLFTVNDKTQNLTVNNITLGDINYVSKLGSWELSDNGLHVSYMPGFAVCYYGSKSCYNGIIYENVTFNDTDYRGYDDRFTVFESGNGESLEIRLHDGKITVDTIHTFLGIETSRLPEYTNIALSDTLGSMNHKLEYYYYMFNDTLYLSYDNFDEPDFIVIRDAFGTKNYFQTENGKNAFFDSLNRTSQCRAGTNSYNFYIHSTYNIFSINQVIASNDISINSNDTLNVLNGLFKVVKLSVPDSIIPVWLQFLAVDLPLIGLILWGITVITGIL